VLWLRSKASTKRFIGSSRRIREKHNSGNVFTHPGSKPDERGHHQECLFLKVKQTKLGPKRTCRLECRLTTLPGESSLRIPWWQRSWRPRPHMNVPRQSSGLSCVIEAPSAPETGQQISPQAPARHLGEVSGRRAAPEAATMTDRFISIHEVRDRTSLSKTHIYRLMDRGRFPRPVPLGPRRVAWREGEVEAWMEERVSERGCRRSDCSSGPRLTRLTRLTRLRDCNYRENLQSGL
jgi:prophage regulatory protein